MMRMSFSLLSTLAIAVLAAAPALAAPQGGHAGHHGDPPHAAPDANHAGHAAPAAADPHAGHAAQLAAGAKAAQPAAPADLSIPDVPVITHDGREVRFYSDLVAGRTVAMNFIFTTCTTVCPPMGAYFGQLQNELGERLGRDVHLISVSIDPLTDTAERMAAWGARFGARDGWTLVTGDVHEIDRLLKALGVFTPDAEDHAPVALIGNDAAGAWTRASGLARPAELASLIDRAAAAGGGR
jgi:protein SCO1/2